MIPASDRAPGTPSASLGLGLLICRMNTEVLAPWGHSAMPTDVVFLVGTKEGGRALPGGERPRAGHGANPSLMPRRVPPTTKKDVARRSRVPMLRKPSQSHCPELRVGEKTVTCPCCLTQSGPDPG